MRNFLNGATTVAIFGLFMGNMPAFAQATPVVEQCPVATWTIGYNLWELIPLAESQYKLAIVDVGPTNVRAGVGFDAAILFTAVAGTQVTVLGEAWDTACNQWMYVRLGDGLYWMYGGQVRFL